MYTTKSYAAPGYFLFNTSSVAFSSPVYTRVKKTQRNQMYYKNQSITMFVVIEYLYSSNNPWF